MTAKTDELKPCPFCGGDAELIVAHQPLKAVFVNCQACDASGHIYTTPQEAIAAWNSRAAQPAAYKDSTPDLRIGDSSFEAWFSGYNPAGNGDKQRARDAYAAGMGDPLVTYAQPTSSAEPCPICFEDEAHSGTCGSDDPKALCNRAAKPAASAEPICWWVKWDADDAGVAPLRAGLYMFESLDAAEKYVGKVMALAKLDAKRPTVVPLYATPVAAQPSVPVGHVTVGAADHGPFMFEPTPHGFDALPDGQHPVFASPVVAESPVSNGWIPTPENINALPEPVRRYICELETNADPAGMVAENALLRDRERQLECMYKTWATSDRRCNACTLNDFTYCPHNSTPPAAGQALPFGLTSFDFPPLPECCDAGPRCGNAVCDAAGGQAQPMDTSAAPVDITYGHKAQQDADKVDATLIDEGAKAVQPASGEGAK